MNPGFLFEAADLNLPKLVKSAQNPELKKAIEEHIAQSEGQVKRLEKVAEMGGFKTSGKECKAAKGLVEECVEHLEEGKPGPTMDAAIISCAQKNEHYEICSYGTVLAWAEALGHEDIAMLLEESLQEEIDADEMLSDISETVNKSAVEGSSSEGSKSKGASMSNEAHTDVDVSSKNGTSPSGNSSKDGHTSESKNKDTAKSK